MIVKNEYGVIILPETVKAIVARLEALEQKLVAKIEGADEDDNVTDLGIEPVGPEPVAPVTEPEQTEPQPEQPTEASDGQGAEEGDQAAQDAPAAGN